MKFCQELDRCVAFTTDGTPKTRVVSIEAMIGSSRSDDSGLGLYIDGESTQFYCFFISVVHYLCIDIDVCAADLRSCSKTAHCVSEGISNINCVYNLLVFITKCCIMLQVLGSIPALPCWSLR